jgi:hypothetical protein
MLFRLRERAGHGRSGVRQIDLLTTDFTNRMTTKLSSKPLRADGLHDRVRPDSRLSKPPKGGALADGATEPGQASRPSAHKAQPLLRAAFRGEWALKD